MEHLVRRHKICPHTLYVGLRGKLYTKTETFVRPDTLGLTETFPRTGRSKALTMSRAGTCGFRLTLRSGRDESLRRTRVSGKYMQVGAWSLGRKGVVVGPQYILTRVV